MNPDRWTLTFEPLPHDVPATVRIRHLLKYALRTLRLKCVSVDGEKVRQTRSQASERASESD